MSQAQATSTMSADVALTFTNAFPPRSNLTYTYNNRQEDFFLIQSKPKNKTQNQLQDTEKNKTQKDWSNNLGRQNKAFTLKNTS